MSSYTVLVTLSLLAAVAMAQYQDAPGPYQAAPQQAQGYGSEPQGYGHASAPVYENYGPDNAQYYYNVQNYDPYLYKNANLNFNRYPGGAAYQLNEDGKGSYVNVNVETYRAGYGNNNKTMEKFSNTRQS